MSKNNYGSIALTVIAAVLIASCNAGGAEVESSIATSVALTVSAQESSAPDATETPGIPQPTAFPTKTPVQFIPTLTALAPVASPTRQASSGASSCARASLVSETVSDGTIFKPGDAFTKTWEIKNTSTCYWDTSYKIIFWDGDVLGGAYVYNLPQAVPPGGVVPISLVLKAPTTDGTYTSKWMLQTPDSVEFGVGDLSAPFYAQIVVSSSANPNYGVTSVTYTLEASPPPDECPTNVTYTAYATVTTNGPLTFNYYWQQSDGHNPKGKVIKMEKAGSIVLSNSWTLHISANKGTRWMAIAIGPYNGDTYDYVVYPKVEFTKLCGS